MRYILHPGYIAKKITGQIHFISYSQLITAYNLCFDECTRYDRNQGLTGIHLYPLVEGNYEEVLKQKRGLI